MPSKYKLVEPPRDLALRLVILCADPDVQVITLMADYYRPENSARSWQAVVEDRRMLHVWPYITEAELTKRRQLGDTISNYWSTVLGHVVGNRKLGSTGRWGEKPIRIYPDGRVGVFCFSNKEGQWLELFVRWRKMNHKRHGRLTGVD